ncbi:MAG: twin-arginine translocation signal domain-containing protein, partial [Opitutaceae bacterium]
MSTSRYFPCAGGRALHAPTRRDFLYSLGASLGSVAFSALLSSSANAAEKANPLAPRPGHLPAKAKNCIFLMMEGG